MNRIFIGLLAVAGCSIERSPEQSATANLPDRAALAAYGDSALCPPSVGAGNAVASKGGTRRTLRGAPRDDEIISAVRFANGLEHRLYDSTRSFRSRDAVLAHYRQGFAENLAQRLTDYSWSRDSSVLRCCRDAALMVPDSVVVVSKNDTTAVVVYPTPPFLRERWGFEPYSSDELRRCDGRWVITANKELQKRPPELHIPPAA